VLIFIFLYFFIFWTSYIYSFSINDYLNFDYSNVLEREIDKKIYVWYICYDDKKTSFDIDDVNVELEDNSEKNIKDLDISNEIKVKRLQKKTLSCELSVAADIISYLTSKNVTEDDVLNSVNKTYLNKLPYKKWDKIIWWNPNEWFIGYIDYYWAWAKIKPTQRDMTWYWIYEKAIAKVYEKYNLDYFIISEDNYNSNFDSKSHLTFLLKNLLKWNMVQLWWDWCTRSEYDDWTISRYDITQEKADNKIYAKNNCPTTNSDRKLEWYYLENWKLKKETWLIWEHAFYLLWYEWSLDNPKKVIVWDSDTWYHKYNIEEWMRKWSLMAYKSLVVRKP